MSLNFSLTFFLFLPSSLNQQKIQILTQNCLPLKKSRKMDKYYTKPTQNQVLIFFHPEFEELKDIPREIDPKFGQRISEQPTRLRNLSKKMQNRMKTALNRYHKRAKEHVYKKRKTIDYHSGAEPFMVKDEKFIKRHKLEYLFDDDPDKEDDYDSDDEDLKESDFRPKE